LKKVDDCVCSKPFNVLKIPRSTTVAELLTILRGHPDFCGIERPHVRCSSQPFPLHTATKAGAALNEQSAAMNVNNANKTLAELGVVADNLFVDNVDLTRSDSKFTKSVFVSFE
jgi:hypothetical protein